MDAETLERLLIDRRLGELPPDAARLLDAYLELSPGERGIGARVETTLELARQAVSAERSEVGPVPMLSSRALAALHAAQGPTISKEAPRRGSTLGRVGAWGRRTAVAATIGLAFVLGYLTSGGAAPRPFGIVAIAPGESRQAAVHKTAETPEAFWSIERLRKAASDRAPETRPRIIWSSPLGHPRMGENT